MKKICPLVFPFACLIAIATVGCSKTGPQGQQGLSGAAGNANVWTDTFTVQNNQWGVGGDAVYTDSMYSNGTLTKSYVISLDQITAGILDSGDVSVYFDPNSAGDQQELTWQPLPFEYTNIDTYAPLIWDYNVKLGKLTLFMYFLPASTGRPNVASYNPGDHQFKVVVTAGHL
jgi:hypothetical protein